LTLVCVGEAPITAPESMNPVESPGNRSAATVIMESPGGDRSSAGSVGAVAESAPVSACSALRPDCLTRLGGIARIPRQAGGQTPECATSPLLCSVQPSPARTEFMLGADASQFNTPESPNCLDQIQEPPAAASTSMMTRDDSGPNLLGSSSSPVAVNVLD